MFKFGILGNAKIAREQVCPAIIAAGHQVHALATYRPESASDVVEKFSIERVYSDYDALLADNDIDAIYIPLPNHLHVEYSIKGLKAGKAVLCEKPVALDIADLERLETAVQAYPGVLMEAFMVAYNPQWRLLREEILPKIGPVQSAHTIFAYRNLDPNNIRAKADLGGGGLLDIGCYATLAGRWIFDAQPQVLASRRVLDREGGVDRLTSALLDYGQGRTYAFTVATQACLHQRISILGTQGWAEVMVPFNPDASANAHFRWEAEGGRGAGTVHEMPLINQYTEMVKAFADKIAAGQSWNNLEQSRQVISVLDTIKEQSITDVVPSAHLSSK